MVTADDLPRELLPRIFLYVPTDGLATARTTCRVWQEVLDSADDIWDEAYSTEFGILKADDIYRASYGLRNAFLMRWSITKRWGKRPPTCCTIMGHCSHKGTVTCVRLMETLKDGQRFLSGSDDGSLFLWKLNFSTERVSKPIEEALCQQHHRQNLQENVRQTLQFYGHGGPVWCVDFGDQSTVISGSYDSTIKVWELGTGKCLRTLRGHSGWVNCLRTHVTPDATHVVSGGSDAALKLWNLPADAAMQPLARNTLTHQLAPSEVIHCLAWEGGPKVLAGIAESDHIVEWDLETNAQMPVFGHHDDVVYALTSANDLVVSGSRDKKVRMWDKRSPTCTSILKGHTGAVIDVAVRGNRMVSSSMDKSCRVWDVRFGCLATLEGHSAPVFAVDLLDAVVVSGSVDTSVKVWSVA